MSMLNRLRFDTRFTDLLPGDICSDNTRRQVYHACYSYVKPVIPPQPQCLAYSQDTAALLGLSEQDCQSEQFCALFSGTIMPDTVKPYAHCYGGHQFGHWAGQLGDGRVVNLGDIISTQGKRYTVQLKGAGPTPYSRSGDGFAVLRSSLREFLCSEAMAHLGIPTTRALSLISTGQPVIRDMFYDGRPQSEPGAIVCRVAPSFLRFGSLELFSARQDYATLKTLLDYILTTYYPHLGKPEPETYLAWLQEVTERTAELIVHWMRVGFVHGVLNTDNMSVLGLTIDYGPYGWLDDFDPNWTPNMTDARERRYRYANQPHIAQWNLLQLANALYPLIQEAAPLCEIISAFSRIYEQKLQTMRASKLGLSRYYPELQNRLYQLLVKVETDMTIFFRNLAQINWDLAETQPEQLMLPLLDAYYQPGQIIPAYRRELTNWLLDYRQALIQEGWAIDIWRQRIMQTNPKYVLRNYLAQQAIDAAEQGDVSMIDTLLSCLRHPYDEQPEMVQFAAKRPDWARTQPGSSMLSCSS